MLSSSSLPLSMMAVHPGRLSAFSFTWATCSLRYSRGCSRRGCFVSLILSETSSRKATAGRGRRGEQEANAKPDSAKTRKF